MAQTTEWVKNRQGNRCFRAKQYDEAEKLYRSALKVSPNNPRILFNLGDVYLAKNDPSGAMKQFQAAAQTEKSKIVRSMAHHNMGYIFQTSAGQPENAEKKQSLLKQAIEEYKKALRNNPKDEDTRYNLALCQKQLKDEQNNSTQQQQKQNQQQEEQSQNDKSQSQQQEEKSQQDESQTEQLLNLSKQAEKKAREKVNAVRPRRKSLEKNW